MSGISPWLRQHPVLALLTAVGAILAGSALNVWIEGILGYVAYGACLMPAIAIVRLLFQREGP